MPTVSVIIATYNWSSVLHFAVSSVLAQTWRDFELLVVGDACTDDSEAVVRAFDDPRVQWHNLADNVGSQFGPNNHGLALARGRYVAYLGHDDLWHRDHLAVLVHAIEAREADFVFAITESVGPPAMPTRTLLGLTPDDGYEWSVWVPPSSWLHRRDLLERVGPWRDSRTMLLPPDVEFLSRVFEAGCRIVPVNELTVFKFPSVERTNAYVDRRSDEQAAWWARLGGEPDLRYREFVGVVKELARHYPEIVQRASLPSRVSPGSMMTGFRARRGLVPPPPATASSSGSPIFADRTVLRYLNAGEDIGPADHRLALHGGSELPVDGLFVGLNWHSLEVDDAGTRWRWIDTDAGIVVTRPSGTRRHLSIDLIPGPGVGGTPSHLRLCDRTGAVVCETAVRVGSVVTMELPAEALADRVGTVFSIGTDDGGRSIRGDPRILNFRVFSFGWAVSA